MYYEILVSRLIDRALRPLFPSDFHAEVFVNVNLLSADKNDTPDALAGLAALLGHHAMTCCMVIANRYAQKMNTDYKSSIDTIIQKVLDRI